MYVHLPDTSQVGVADGVPVGLSNGRERRQCVVVEGELAEEILLQDLVPIMCKFSIFLLRDRLRQLRDVHKVKLCVCPHGSLIVAIAREIRKICDALWNVTFVALPDEPRLVEEHNTPAEYAFLETPGSALQRVVQVMSDVVHLLFHRPQRDRPVLLRHVAIDRKLTGRFAWPGSEEWRVAVRRARRGDGDGGVVVDGPHAHALFHPVRFRVLNDAQCVNPQIPDL